MAPGAPQDSWRVKAEGEDFTREAGPTDPSLVLGERGGTLREPSQSRPFLPWGGELRGSKTSFPQFLRVSPKE